MGELIYNGPPPGVTDGACVVCLSVAKQRQHENAEERGQVKAGLDAPDDEIMTIPWDDSLNKKIRPGPYRAISGDAPSLGIVDLCWNHVAGVSESRRSHLLSGGKIPPGLIKGGG